MEYKLIKSNEKDIDKLIEWKLSSILDYAEDLSKEKLEKINNYVKNNIPLELVNYKNIVVNDKIIGCLLLEPKEDGVLLNEIYIIKDYRGKNIGTSIIKNIIRDNNTVYLWVYKLNKRAISLYKKLGFYIIDESDSRYYMKFTKKKSRFE